ncbi:hypothetical protein, partial [Azospirillum sp.]|uniref:hypothetical protein n=1 Tax=Azospirillum sp. TaxID=34012 RepID=UPI002D5CF4E1
MSAYPAASDKTADLLRHLAGRPGHDEVKAGFRQLLIEEFGAEIDAIRFEHRVPEVRGRLDALIGHTVFEAKRDLEAEWRDVERRMPEYLADRERAEGERFVGIASDGRQWVVTELQAGKLAVVKRTTLDPEKQPCHDGPGDEPEVLPVKARAGARPPFGRLRPGPVRASGSVGLAC